MCIFPSLKFKMLAIKAANSALSKKIQQRYSQSSLDAVLLKWIFIGIEYVSMNHEDTKYLEHFLIRYWF